MGSFVVFALFYSSQVEAVKLRDIFDAYDEESKKEAMDANDQIDATQLAAEIGGEEIAREVKGATEGVAEQAQLLQLDQSGFGVDLVEQSNLIYIPEENIYLQKNLRPIKDEDGDGVADNEHKTREELDRFYIPKVFGPSVEEIHNTCNGDLPGHTQVGEHPQPTRAQQRRLSAEMKDHERFEF